LEYYKVPLTRSNSKKHEIHQETQEFVNITIMDDREEQRNEIPNDERERNVRQRNLRRRSRSYPLNL
jgi:hypothetical protein